MRPFRAVRPRHRHLRVDAGQDRRHVHGAAVLARVRLSGSTGLRRRAQEPHRRRILPAARVGSRKQVALEGIQALGGNGYINEFATGRILRDTKLYVIGAGTNEVRRMLIRRELFDGRS